MKIIIGGGQTDNHVRACSGADVVWKDVMDAVKLSKGYMGR